ncbi:MAG TPA: adenylate/guanylate cyclase domain-containing protein [Dongiaceae bacterium]|nr:adenylate/guanylate cyclase domain-containing protein [Dongiaceae bacterium]
MEAPPLERKLIAILATLSAHRAVADALIARHGGRICNTAGDSILAEFGSVFAAVQCAVEIQRDLAEANQQLAPERQMRFRIGINLGDVMVKDGDIFGDGVNIAARIEGLAEAGGICISRGVRDHIRRKLPYGFEDMGEQSVKNIAQPIRVFRLRPDQAAESGAPAHAEPDTQSSAKDQQAEAHARDEHAGETEPQSVELVFWESIKDSLRAADYEAYLEQYPEGSFIALAQTRLEEIAAAHGHVRDPQDREVELAFWESVHESDSRESLKAYLEKYPEGEFKPLAEIRLKELGA